MNSLQLLIRSVCIAVTFYRLASCLRLSSHLKDQLNRAAASVVLNLAEGYGRLSKTDQRRFYVIAFGSLRECQAVLDLAQSVNSEILECSDKLAAHLYKLIQKL